MQPNFKQPLAEVFGFLPTDLRKEAQRYRENKLCPFNNKVPNCTKDKAKDPLGVCSVYKGENPIVTCPVRFRQDWLIATDAADFFFAPGTKWTTLTEIRLNDAEGESAGNIDVILAAYDDSGKIFDFGALEVQAVYISGNVRNPFVKYMGNPKAGSKMKWNNEVNYPSPDFLSSSRKRLAPQLIYKGGILSAWKKKTAVALDRYFFDTLPQLEQVPAKEADLAWLVYDLILENNRYKLTSEKVVYTKFETALRTITVSRPGKVEDFVEKLQVKLDEQLKTPPTTETLTSLT